MQSNQSAHGTHQTRESEQAHYLNLSREHQFNQAPQNAQHRISPCFSLQVQQPAEDSMQMRLEEHNSQELIYPAFDDGQSAIADSQ